MTAIIRVEEWDVEHRLGDFDLTQEKLVDVVRACVAAYGGCTDNDPPTAKGWELWRWGVRRSREILRPEEWEKDDTGGFSTIVNHKRRFRIAIASADDATGRLGGRDPQNRSRKGPASERATTVNQLLLPGSDAWPRSKAQVDEYETWHLCVYVGGDAVRAELSRFNGFEGGYLTDCHERIILLGDGDWEKLDFGTGDNDLGPEIEVDVQRKN